MARRRELRVGLKRRSAAGERFGRDSLRQKLPVSIRALFWFMALSAVVSNSGCQWARQRLSLRSAECNQLCEEARTAREQGQHQAADELLAEAIRRRPADLETRLQLADEVWSSGRQLAAAAEVEQLLVEWPEDAEVALKLARMQLELGRTVAARQAVTTALRVEPECIEGLKLKARIDDRDGQWDAALATYLRIGKLAPDDVEVPTRMGELYLRKGQPDRAAPLFRQAAHHPHATVAQRTEAEWHLGTAYAQMKRWDDAAATLQTAIAKRANATAEDWYRVAYAQAQCGQKTLALRGTEQALERKPDHAGAKELASRLSGGSSPAVGATTGIIPAGFRTATIAPGS